MNVVFPFDDVNWIAPLWASIILLDSVKLMPEPFLRVVKYGIKTLSLISSEIPIPLSIIDTCVRLLFDEILILYPGYIYGLFYT